MPPRGRGWGGFMGNTLGICYRYAPAYRANGQTGTNSVVGVNGANDGKSPSLSLARVTDKPVPETRHRG